MLGGMSKRLRACTFLHPAVLLLATWVVIPHRSNVGVVLHSEDGSPYPFTANTAQRSLVGRTQDLKDLVQLIHIVTSLEQRLSSKHLGKDTSDRPHVN